MSPKPTAGSLKENSVLVGPRALRLVTMAPDIILAIFMAVCVSVTAAISVHLFTPWLVILLFVLIVVPLVRLVPSPPSGPGQVIGAVVAVGGAAVWIVANLPYVAQMLWASRDPGIYTLLGVWMRDHHTILSIQGGLALPGLLGIGGWIDGIQGVLHANLFAAAVGLVGVYAVARRFVRWWLALAAEAALGLSVAFLYLMRAPYSESVVLAAGLAAAVWAIAAFRETRVSLAVVGGVYVGVAAMARVDGPLLLVGVGAAMTLVGLIATNETFVRMRGVVAAHLAGSFLASLLGFAAVMSAMSGYVRSLRGEVAELWLGAIGVTLAAAAVLIARSVWARTGRRWELSGRLLRLVAAVSGSAVPLLFLVWGTRPLWWQAHDTAADSAYAQVIAELQRQAGLAVDGTRSYDELTLHWVGWYFGWATVVLAAVGLGLMVWWGLARRDAAVLVLVVPAGLAALLYMDKVSITPDQVWAYRRLLPIITPALLVGAVVTIEAWLSRSGRRRVPRLLKQAIGLLAALAVAAGPLLAWNSLLRLPEGSGDVALTHDLCEAATADSVFVATGHPPGNIWLTLYTVCGKRVVLGAVSQRDQLDALANGTQVMAFAPADLPHGTKLGAPNVHGTQTFWRPTLVSLPKDRNEVEWSIWVGHVENGDFVQDPVRH